LRWRRFWSWSQDEKGGVVAGLRQGRYPVNPVGVNGLTPTQKKELPPGSRCPSTSSGRRVPDREQPRQAEGEGVRESSTVVPGRAEV